MRSLLFEPEVLGLEGLLGVVVAGYAKAKGGSSGSTMNVLVGEDSGVESRDVKGDGRRRCLQGIPFL
jgi:hypothetical protein